MVTELWDQNLFVFSRNLVRRYKSYSCQSQDWVRGAVTTNFQQNLVEQRNIKFIALQTLPILELTTYDDETKTYLINH